jgi:glycosyltransferase involved in cell wall biosynthesis/tetratricopeptide (TPR) repeat protein
VPAADALTARVWQALGAADAGDPTLAADLLSGPPSPLRGGGGGEGFRLNALGVVEALAGRDPRAAARCFQQAALAGGVVAALNVVEALAVLGEKSLAAEGARKLLARLLGGGLPPRELDQPHYPPGYTLFRVEWERAAWQSAGRPRDEARAKLRLVRWRLHSLLAELTGELPHHHEAAVERPDLPPTRAALGCALGAAGRPAEAAAHLHAASLANPFDRAAARALYAGQTAQADALARDRLLLRLSAPAAVAAEDWALQPRRGNAPANPTSPLALVWEGAFLAQHSLGLLNRALCHRLMHRGHELSLTPIPSPGPQIEPGPDRDRLAARFAHPLSRPEDACVRLGWPPRWQAPAHGKWVVVQPWEYGSLPRDWLAPLRQQVDEVWVPTAFVRDGFVQSGVPADRVHVVPCGVDAAAFRPGLDPRPLPTTRRFRFLFVGGTIHRKGVDVLLAAYARAFRASDDVCLVVKDMGVGSFYAGQTAENRVGAFRADAGNPEVVYLDDSLTEAEMARLYNACDCLVHPYRGEGFGLPILEAMACGVPVVVTGYGAALDFCDEATAALIPAKVVPFPENKVGDIPTVGRPWLAEPDEEALADLLRRAVEHPREARQRAALARQRVLGGFTWDHAARTAEGRLLALREAPQLRQPARRAAPFLPPSPSASGGEGPGVRGVFPGASTCQPITAKASLCLIVKNEEDNIAACLQSAAGLFDDVVVVDTGSADRTKQIALGHGARVFDFPWVDDFAAARNETLRHAKGEWIFWLDADDRLDEDNREKLRLLLQRLPEHNVCFSVKCRCLSDPASDASTVVDHIRLFRNDPRIAWRYRIHEQILPSIREAGGRVEHADVEVLHTGYADAALRRRKLERDLRLLLLEHAAQPHDPFTLFNLGASYAELRRHDEALPLLQESLARSHPSDSIVRKLYALIASCHLTTGRHAEALAVCSQGLAVCPDDQELLFLEALIRTGQDDLHTAKAVLLRLLAAEPGKHFASVVDGLRGHKGRHQLALVCFRLGEFCEAEPLWQAVLRDRPGFLPARVGLAELYLHQERWPDLEATLAALEQSPPGAAEAALLRGKAHLARREFAAARSLLEAERARRPDCLAVLTTLSHVLLQEDRDHAAAEGLLCDILAHDPGHAQARQNLLALRRRTAAG